MRVEEILFYSSRVPSYMTAGWYLQANGNRTQDFKFSLKIFLFEEPQSHSKCSLGFKKRTSQASPHGEFLPYINTSNFIG